MTIPTKSVFLSKFWFTIMTDEGREQLSVFEARIRHLMFLHDELKLQHAQLKEILEEKNQTISQLQTELQTLHESYGNLKQALTISLDGSDVKETRQELSRLVREIDKCISMLINN